jgi:hypothetical protein
VNDEHPARYKDAQADICLEPSEYLVQGRLYRGLRDRLPSSVASLIRAVILLQLLVYGGGVDAAESVKLFKQFDLGKGDAVLCYDKDPAFVFASTSSSTTSSIKLILFDGRQEEIVSINGGILPDSLSCSDDGRTIAFVREKGSSQDFGLFIIKDGAISEYNFKNWADEYPIEGTRSLLSEDGRGIALPGSPSHVSGPDIIRQMHLFVYENGKPFFVNDALLFDRGTTLESLSFDGSMWKRMFIVEKDPSLFLEQAGLCFDRLIALASADEADKPGKIFDLTSGKFQKPDWPDASQVIARTKQLGNALVAGASYNRCFYVVEKWVTNHFDLKALAVIEHGSASVFIVPNDLTGNREGTTLASRRIGITKDGCYVLASTYLRQPQANRDWHDAGTHAVVLQLRGNSPICH